MQHNHKFRKESLAEIQKDIISHEMIRKANRENKTVDVVALQRILNEIEVNSRLEFPFFFPYLMEDNQPLDIDKFNDSIRFISADVETLMYALGLMENKIHKMDRSIDRNTLMMLSAMDKLDERFKQFRERINLARFTHRMNMSSTDGFDLSLTTADIDTDRRLITAKKANMYEGNIKIGPMSPENLQAVTDDIGTLAVDGNFYNLYVPGNRKTSTINVTKERRERTNIAINANFSDIAEFRANTIIIRTANVVPAETNISIVSGGDIKRIVNNAFLANSTYTFTFDPIKIDKIIINMYQNTETYISENDRFIYSFKLDFISPEFVNYTNQVEAISNAIEVPFGITDVGMNVTDHRPEDTDIEYFVSTNQVDWIPIIPRNIARSPNNVVNIGSRSTVPIEIIDRVGDPGKTNPWHRLTPHEEYGNIQLYNILEYANDANALSGQVDIEADKEVVPESIRVYRGMDDYSIDKTRYTFKIDVQDVLYRSKKADVPDSTPQEQYLIDQIKVPLFTRIDDEVHIVDTNGKVRVNYDISNNNIVVIDLENEVEKEVLSYSGNEITLIDTNVNTKVGVTYHTLLETIENTDNVIIEIDTTTVKYKFDDTQDVFVNGNDITISPYDKKAILKLNNAIPISADSGWYTFYLSFQYLKKSRDEYDVYRTYVYYPQDYSIEIFPFTEEEIFAGNFHIIDGYNASRSVEHTVKGGLHEIVTTQPFKTDPSNPVLDVNKLTGKPSNAGIVLGEYEYRRGYKKSMRQVSTFALSNVIGPSDRDAFAFEDNMVLINYVPEYLPDEAATYATHLTGEKLLLKTAEYLSDGKNTFDRYITQDEQFLIEFDVQPKEGTEDDIRTLYVRVLLTPNREKGKSPKIFRYSVFFY